MSKVSFFLHHLLITPGKLIYSSDTQDRRASGTTASLAASPPRSKFLMDMSMWMSTSSTYLCQTSHPPLHSFFSSLATSVSTVFLSGSRIFLIPCAGSLVLLTPPPSLTISHDHGNLDSFSIAFLTVIFHLPFPLSPLMLKLL